MDKINSEHPDKRIQEIEKLVREIASERKQSICLVTEYDIPENKKTLQVIMGGNTTFLAEVIQTLAKGIINPDLGVKPRTNIN